MSDSESSCVERVIAADSDVWSVASLGDFLLVARFDGLDLLLQVRFHERGEPLVGLRHLGRGIGHGLVRLADRLLDLPEPRLELFERAVHGLHTPGDRLLRALPDGLQALGDLLGRRSCGCSSPRWPPPFPAGVGIHLREDLIHLRKPRLMALGRLRKRCRR